MLGGKVHNIETIQGKDEQNLFSVIINVPKDSIVKSSTNASNSIIRFDIPVLIHTTVLPPQKDADIFETGIPKNSKVYVNFLKSNASDLLKGRFVTDCLFESIDNGFVSVGSIDDNINKRVVEQRLTLNFAYYSFVVTMTAIFGVFGFLVFVKIIISGFRPVNTHEYHSHPPAPEPKKRESVNDHHLEETRPLIGGGKEKLE